MDTGLTCKLEKKWNSISQTGRRITESRTQNKVLKRVYINVGVEARIFPHIRRWER